MGNDTSIQICNKRICNSDSQKLLEVSIDQKLRFNDHVSNLCNKASQKLNALARFAPYMEVAKKRVLMKAFIYYYFIIIIMTSIPHIHITWLFVGHKHKNRLKS